MHIGKYLRRGVSGAVAAAIGMQTLAVCASAATSGVNIGYTWDSSVNPTINSAKNAVSGGVSGQYIKSGEQLCRFAPSTTSDWAFCIEPAKSMQGTPDGTWYTQYGFTEFDTFDMSDKNRAESFDYWSRLGGTDGELAQYMGLVQYYGYASHKNGDYYAATQIIIWELILGYRGHTRDTFKTCSDELWNDFTYPSGGWCTRSGVEAAYKEIVKNVKSHYNLPKALKASKELAKEDPAMVFKYNTDTMRYEASFGITADYVTGNNLAHNFSTLESKLLSFVKGGFKGTYGEDIGITKSTSDGYTTYTVWSKGRPFTSSSADTVYTTGAITMQLRNGMTEFENLFANGTYQTCLLSTRITPVSGYIGMASYNEPNLTVEKTYTDSGNNAVTAETLSKLLEDTSFVVSTTINNTKYYVVAKLGTQGKTYFFNRYTTSLDEATKFKTTVISDNKGSFKINDLPTSESSGRTYTITEYSVPDDARYEKLSKSVTLPSPTSDFMTNAGTKTIKINNSEEGFEAECGTAVLEKHIVNGDGKAFSSDNADDIAKLADVYKSTKYIVGYWDGNSMRYLTNAYLDAKSAFDGNISDVTGLSSAGSRQGDGVYYVPTTINSEHKIVFDTARTSTDISRAYVFSAGNNHSGTETCEHFGEVYLDLLPLDNSGRPQEIVFIEVNGAKGYGYDEKLKTADAISLSSLGKNSVSGLVKNDAGKSFTLTDTNGTKYVIAADGYYPVCSTRTEGKNRSEAEIVNELVNYELVLMKKDSSGKEKLSGAKYGLYNSNKKLLKTATTGADGTLRFEYDLVPNTDYFVHEITAPAGYALDNAYYKINRENGSSDDTDFFENAKLSDYEYTVSDKPFELKIELNKYDILNDVKIEGITFDVALDGKTVGSMTTDKNGHAEMTGLSLGKLNGNTFSNVYTVTERENDKYIMLDEDGNAARKFDIVTTLDDVQNAANPVITYTADIPNTLQTVELKVHKTDEYNNPVKGVSFDISPAEDIAFNGKVVQRKGEKLGTITTNEKGEASAKYTEYESDGTQGYTKTIPIFPNHEYTLTETGAPEPYVIPKDNVTKFTAKSEKANTLTIPHDVTVKDNVQNGILDVYKFDSEKKIPLAGAEFEIRAAEDFSIGSKQIHKKGDLICKMITGSDGHANSGASEMFVGAKYTLTETKAVEGYCLIGGFKDFEFKFAGNHAEYSKLTVEVDNTPQKGKIGVHKTGDVFDHVEALAPAICIDEQGVTHTSGYMIYTPVFEEHDLEGAVFEVKDVNTGTTVCEITTDKKGYAETPALPLGKYTVYEKTAPDGYVKNTKAYPVELKYAGQTINISDAVRVEARNDLQQVKIHLKKLMEHDEEYNVGSAEDRKNVAFGLYAAEKLTAANGSVIPEEGLIYIAYVHEDMTAAFDGNIPFGKYYVKELSTDEKYVLNGEKYIVTFEYKGQEVQTVDIDCGTFTNKLKRGAVEGIKIDEHENPLTGAEFGLFNADSKEFNSGNALQTAVSDKDGKFGFKDIPFGKYIVTEIKAPSGYVFSDTKYTVNITEDKQIVKLRAVNNSFPLKISKKDVYGKELAGAEMQIIDSTGKVIDEWTSDGSEHIVSALTAGKYILHESASPAGYVLSADIHFSIDGENKVTVEKTDALTTDADGIATITMIDDVTKVTISKFDITGKKELPGAMLRIIDADGNTVDEWVSDGKPHELKGRLIAGGSYKLHEITAPEGYAIANDITFTVNADGSITKVVMNDDTTKVRISKKKITGNDELPGAKLQVLDKTGKVVDEWTSTTEPHYIEGVLTAGRTYILHENASPDGCVIAQDIEFTVNSDSSITEVVMIDDTTKVSITKYDITGEKEIAGAKLQVIEGSGKVVDEWISTDSAHEINGLLTAGAKYILHEVYAPDGYVVVNDVAFTVSQNGEVTKVSLYDDTTKVRISKKNITTGNKLPGAKLQVLDKSGNIIDEWTSTTEPHYIEAVLTAGETYTLHETAAPNGWVLANDVKFTVNTDGTVNEVEMVDDITKVHITKTDITGEKELTGASLKVIDENGNIIDEWVSTNEAHKIEGKLIAGKTYTLHEEVAPDGYVVANDITFTVSADGSVDRVVMKDDTTKVHITKTDITGEKELTGASLKVIDENGNVVDEWVSTTEAHKIEGKLIAGKTYTLHEEVAPDGYVVANDITFTVSADGSVDKVVMKDDTTKVHITKTDITGEKELAGASLIIFDENGKVVDEWVSTNEAHIIEGKLIAGKIYTLHEEIAPDGYVIANDITFTVSADGSVDKVVMKDDTTKVHIIKTDITGEKELSGASLKILDENGNIIDEWISTSDAHIIEGKLIAGKTYTLHEEVAPNGYVVANYISFTVSADGKIDIVTMKDDTTKVKISKRDITTNEELPGAKLQILCDGEVIEEWVSTNEPHIIEGVLAVGKDYVLREITAPEGFEIAKEITFRVNEDGSVTEIIMFDEHTPDQPSVPTTPGSPSTPGTPDKPSKPSTPSTPDKPSVPEKPSSAENVTTTKVVENPHTGSGAANLAFVGMIAACALMVVAAVRKKG